ALLPRQPGVYYLRDAAGAILYVGKAKNLANRVRSYFRAAHPDPRLERLRGELRDFDYVVTASEAEALILENNCIKESQPPYNVQLKDDKKYPYIKLTTAHPFPGIFVTRTLERDGSHYFGPYTRVKTLRETLKTLRSLFPLRNCTDRRLARDDRECLEYHMGKCVAPCTHRVTQEQYGEIVRSLMAVFEGKGQEVTQELEAKMEAAKSEWRYEDAARLRDTIRGLEQFRDRQSMLRTGVHDADILGLAHRGDRGLVVVLAERGGRVVGRTQHRMEAAEGRSRSEVLEAFLTQFYAPRLQVPGHIALPVPLESAGAIESWLAGKAGHPVRVRRAHGTRWRHLTQTAGENAALALEEEELLATQRRKRVDPAVYALQEALGLSDPPYRIEGYDISNIQGRQAVGSRVVFQDGVPLKAGYRRFRIRNVSGIDDFAMLAEVLGRRLERVVTTEPELPDLILIDGGKGQLSAARKVLRDKGFEGISIIGLAKREEEVVGPKALETRRLPRSSPALKLLQRVRDEAHRFAISYHRRLRGSVLKASSLDAVPGIGHSRKVALLAAFGSLDQLRQASPEEIARVPGFGRQLAQQVHAALRAEAEDEEAHRDA
ncbi:MAG: excinuclease ABC subunit UvrC, partial [Candidatus Eisenbacteria bacterium]|nr:excinuclease ABC subunit UvrC [Candidatus Eisenbacteria bacterium]